MRDRPLALVEAGPVEADVVVGDGPALVVEAAADGVEADDVGAELGEREPAERRGDERRSLDDAQSREQLHRQSDSRRRAWVTTCVERDSSKGIRMAIARQAAPIKFGVLTDMVIPKTPERDVWDDMVLPFELVFRDGFEQGVIDRPVELVRREVEGLPRGTVKAVIDAYGELVDEGCLAVFGPNISENTIPLRAEIERRFHVPAISLCGADDWLGEWTFALPAGSMTDEPILIAHLIARAGLESAGVLVERSLIGQLYLRGFRDACRDAGHRARGRGDDRADRPRHRERGPRRPQGEARRAGAPRLRLRRDPDQRSAGDVWLGPAPVHGHVVRGRVLQPRDLGRVRGLDRPRAVRRGKPGRPALPRPIRGGVRAPARSTSRRWCRRDVAVSFLRAFADAQPLSPRGVLEALERVKMVPAASGSPGTCVSFGKWTRRGWMGAGYLTARAFNPDRETHILAGRYEVI